MTTLSAVQANLAGVNGTSGGNGTQAGINPKLKDAAEQFEAMFLQEMLKPFSSEAGDGFGGDNTEKSPGSDTLSSFGTESLARVISKGGGLGIARQIEEKVSLERAQHAKSQP